MAVQRELEKVRAPGSRYRWRKAPRQGARGVQHSFCLPQNVYREDLGQDREGMLAGDFCPTNGAHPWEFSSHRSRLPGHPWSSAIHSWRGTGRAWHCCFVLEPSASCSLLPHNNILLVRFGETPRSPPDTSTKHMSGQLPSTGVSAHLFRVASHPAFTPCPDCSARPPGEASPSLQFTGVTYKKRLIVYSHLQTHLSAACIHQGLNWKQVAHLKPIT